MKHMKLPMPVAQKIVDYLVSKPWAEVNDLLAMMQQAEVINEEKEEPDGD